MSIVSELEKLTKAKTLIRKAIQRKGTGLTLSETFNNYDDYIYNMSDIRNPDLTGLKDYVEDRLSFLEINVNKIRPYAFRRYTCLQGLYLNTTQVVTLENINAFYGIEPIIFVPESLLNEYKSSSNWSLIANRIQIYVPQVVQEMFLLEGIDKVKKVGWWQTKKISEIQKEFRF